jgi:hypothetical protein
MLLPPKHIHQKGGGKLENELSESVLIPVDTFGGRVHVEWDSEAAVTPLGQMPFFIEFLKLAGLFDSWVEDCPLVFASNNASKKRDVLGTLMLSVLAGHTRYSHITTLRCDGVNPNMLGMSKIISEDTARRAIQKIEENAGNGWLNMHLKKSHEHLLSFPWIMDIDSTIKQLYGKQECAEIGYNPKKPGRPSHTYHTYHIANIRMILDVEVQDGKSNAGCYSAPRLWSLLEEIPKENWPNFIRGDSSYGNEGIMNTAEKIGVKYLFKLKCTTKVKRLIASMMVKNQWDSVGQGWESIDSDLSLSGWSKSRRVVLLRRKLSDQQIGITKKKSNNQLELEFFFAEPNKDISAYEYQVLVTNLDEHISTIAQHYRDRADCENNFDELKNQWGWCGYTTQDLKRCRFMAKITAIVYNWWTIFTRLANPNSHLEAITSRPLLLHAVAKQTSHAGRSKITITSSHSKSVKISQILTAISKFFKKLKSVTEQLTANQRFLQILLVAFRKFLPEKQLNNVQLLPIPG